MADNEPYDASNPDHVKAAIQRSKTADVERNQVMEAIMMHKQTRAWIYAILEFCGCYQSAFSTNALQMAHEAGKQTVGHKIMADVMTAGDGPYLTMVREARERDLINKEKSRG